MSKKYKEKSLSPWYDYDSPVYYTGSIKWHKPETWEYIRKRFGFVPQSSNLSIDKLEKSYKRYAGDKLYDEQKAEDYCEFVGGEWVRDLKDLERETKHWIWGEMVLIGFLYMYIDCWLGNRISNLTYFINHNIGALK